MELCRAEPLPNVSALVPTPWHSESLPAYLYSSTLLEPATKFADKQWYFGFYPTRLQKLFSQRRVDIESRIRRAEKAGWDLTAVFARLRRDGLKARLAGLDFTRLQHTRCIARCRALQLTCTADDCARLGPALLATDLEVRFAMWLLSDVSSKGGTASGLPSAVPLSDAPKTGMAGATGDSEWPRLPAEYAGNPGAARNGSDGSFVSTELQYLFGSRAPWLTWRELQLQAALLRGASLPLLEGVGEARWYFRRYGFYFPGGVSRLLWLCDQRARHDGCSISAIAPGAAKGAGAKGAGRGSAVGDALHGVGRAAAQARSTNTTRARKHMTGAHGGRRAIETEGAAVGVNMGVNLGWNLGEGPRGSAGRRLEGRRYEGKRMLRELQLAGHVAVRDYGAWGLDVQQLHREAMHALDAAASTLRPDAATVSSAAPLPSLRPLLNDETLATLLRRYLGGEVRYDGHTTLRLTRHVSERNYTSSTWHHDRCGKRLKLFIFLNQVCRIRLTFVGVAHELEISCQLVGPKYSSSWVPEG